MLAIRVFASAEETAHTYSCCHKELRLDRADGPRFPAEVIHFSVGNEPSRLNRLDKWSSLAV